MSLTLPINDGLHIDEIIRAVPCKRHGADILDPCFWTHKLLSDGLSFGICNARAKRAGHDHPIDPASLQMDRGGRPKKFNRPAQVYYNYTK